MYVKKIPQCPCGIFCVYQYSCYHKLMKNINFKSAIFFLIILGIAGSIYNRITQPPIPNTNHIRTFETITPKDYEIKAYFSIYTNNTFRIFDSAMYKNQNKDIFIPADSSNKIIIKKENQKWSDLFATLPMKLTKDCLTTGTKQVFCNNSISSLKFYINGKKEENALDMVIGNDDKLLVTYGAKSQNPQDQINKLNELK